MLNLNKWLIIGLWLIGTYGLAVNSLNATEEVLKTQNTFQSDIEGLQESMLSPSFWENKLNPQQSLILSQQQIAQQNTSLLQNDAHMNDLTIFPHLLDKEDITKRIAKSSKLPDSNLYYGNGNQLHSNDFKRYSEALNIKNIQEKIKIQFGMVARRTNLRTFPTSDAVFKTPDSINIDRFQETALFPTEIVAILHESQDQDWYYVVSYNYSGWVKKSKIAIGEKKEIFEYKNSDSFLVITGDKVFTTFNPKRKEVSHVQLDMGTKVTLVKRKFLPTSIDGQNTYASYVIKLPTRTDQGKLMFELALIPRNKDVNVGYLPFTRSNILKQSFKFLGERYGWGHSFNARDCTGFVGDVYKSFGILMPRNTGQQAQSNQGQNIHFTESTSLSEKVARIKNLEVGDLIYIPGHVMMFLGMQDDKPFIIHDVSGFNYLKEDGSYYKSTLNGVSVTPLLPIQVNQEVSYLDHIYNLKKIK